MDHENPIPLGNQSTGVSPTQTIDPVTGQLIGDSIFSVGSNLIQNKGAMKRQLEAQRWNLEMWERQNAYNHPALVMQRYKEAGLNPALMYKGTAQPAGQVAPAKAAPFEFNVPSPNIMGVLQQQESIRNSKMARQVQMADIRLKHQKEMLSMIQRMQGVTQHQKSKLELRIAKEFDFKMRAMELETKAEQLEKVRLDKKLTDAHQKIRNKEWIDYDTLGLRPNDPYAFIIRNLVDQWNKAKKSNNKTLLDQAEDAWNKFLNFFSNNANYEMSPGAMQFWYGEGKLNPYRNE